MTPVEMVPVAVRSRPAHRPFPFAKERHMENPRTETARNNDDSDVIDRASAEPAPSFGGSSGGNIQEDIAGPNWNASAIPKPMRTSISRTRSTTRRKRRPIGRPTASQPAA